MSLHQLEPTCRLPNVSVCSEKLRWSINEVVLDVETLTYTDHLDLARSRNIRLNFQGFFGTINRVVRVPFQPRKYLKRAPFPVHGVCPSGFWVWGLAGISYSMLKLDHAYS